MRAVGRVKAIDSGLTSKAAPNASSIASPIGKACTRRGEVIGDLAKGEPNLVLSSRQGWLENSPGLQSWAGS